MFLVVVLPSCLRVAETLFRCPVNSFLPSLCLEHWDYHAHPHIHPVEYETLQETNFTELQSVQALHPPALIRHDPIRYETENLLDPNLGTHVLQQPVSPSADSEPPSAEIQPQNKKRAFGDATLLWSFNINQEVILFSVNSSESCFFWNDYCTLG